MQKYEVTVADNGDITWYQNGLLHRLDGPAIEYLNGDKFWFQNGKLHRLDGPAVERVDGKCFWYIEGVEYTEVEFNQKINPPKEMSVAELEKILGYPIKIVKD